VKIIAEEEQTQNNDHPDQQATKMIMAIVQRGRADQAVKGALRSGAQAATVFFGRGMGVRERLGFLGLAIQPEKEVIVIVAPRITSIASSPAWSAPAVSTSPASVSSSSPPSTASSACSKPRRSSANPPPPPRATNPLPVPAVTGRPRVRVLHHRRGRPPPSFQT